MKQLFICALTVLIVGCGSGGGSSTAAPSTPPTIDPTCKSIYSVWTSDSDSTVFDFTTLASGATNGDYGWVGYDGRTCGYATTSGHLTAQISSVSISHYQYQLATVADSAESGSCAYYVPPGSSGGLYAWAMIDMTACGEIEVCQNYGSETCKTFH